MTTKKILYVADGSKGGVGKSLVATTVASILQAYSCDLTIIEADRTNPDLARRFMDHSTVLLADVSDRHGWISLLDALEEIQTEHIVMSLPAGLNNVQEIQPLLHRTLKELDIELRLFFCLSRQNDSLDLIEKCQKTGLASIADQAIAVKNGFFGSELLFDRWNQSKQRTEWIRSGKFEAFLPELNSRIVDFLESKPQPLHFLKCSGLTTALRIDLEDWLKSAEFSFDKILTLQDTKIKGENL